MNKLHFHFFIFLLSLSQIVPLDAQAQVSKCDDVWTNKPCSVPTADGFKEKPFTPRSKAELDADSGRSLFNGLDIEATDAKTKYGVITDLTLARTNCIGEAITLSACTDAVQKTREIIDRRIERAEKEKQQADKKTAEAKETATSNTTVVVVHQNERGHHHYLDDELEVPTPLPIPTAIHTPVARPHPSRTKIPGEKKSSQSVQENLK